MTSYDCTRADILQRGNPPATSYLTTLTILADDRYVFNGEEVVTGRDLCRNWNAYVTRGGPLARICKKTGSAHRIGVIGSELLEKARRLLPLNWRYVSRTEVAATVKSEGDNSIDGGCYVTFNFDNRITVSFDSEPLAGKSLVIEALLETLKTAATPMRQG